MRGRAQKLGAASTAALVALAVFAAGAGAFGLQELEVRIEDKEGGPATQAASHPFAITTDLAVETKIDPVTGHTIADGDPREVAIAFPAGLAGNPTAVPRCSAAKFLAGSDRNECPDATALGVARIEFGEPGKVATAPVYNLHPPPGKVAEIGFIVEARAPVTVDFEISPDPPYRVSAISSNISQAVAFLGAEIEIWGVPAAEAHDDQRGACVFSGSGCSVNLPEVPFIDLPSSCSTPLDFDFAAGSWPPIADFAQTVTANAAMLPPGEPVAGGCEKPDFDPQISVRPTSGAAESPSGMDIEVTVDDPALGDGGEEAVGASRIEKTVLELPEGVTVNPSQADGLEACSPTQLAAERADSAPGEGCPQAAKIGTVEVESPLLEGILLTGSLYVATPYENPFGTLIALYMVIREPQLGVLIRLPVKVEADPQSGRLLSTVEGIPDVPVSRFRLHFREGGRSPLVTPPLCGTYAATATFYPHSRPTEAHVVHPSFSVSSGPGGGPCPAGGVPPFSPRLEGGTLSNSAGAYSPFQMRLTRNDGEQDLTRFSAVLPPGVVGRIAGVPYCPDAALAAAAARSGREELASPSCPAASAIGRTAVGAGVGPELTYVPGSLYLAGPYKGAPVSVAAITPALAGPFDAGTVVVREGFTVNPLTGQVEFDGAASDPIPHILKGIPLKVRDLRVYVDRPGFTLNASGCEPQQLRAEVFGSFLDVLDPADDRPASLAVPYQAADCASLGFGPRLSLRFRGQTERTGHPEVRAELVPRAGDANIANAVTFLPKTTFVDAANVPGVCTREEFSREACPKESILGRARAFIPLLDEPLEGPVYFRSNGGARELPDLVADLRGLFRVVLVGYVDSRHSRIRTRFLDVPDAPVSKFVLRLYGGKNRGLVQNSADLCRHRGRAIINLAGQNGRIQRTKQRVNAHCSVRRTRHSRAH